MAASENTSLPELTVSELARKLKHTIETSFGHVRVRGELGRVTIARSGHIYADLKDEQAVLNIVIWKGPAGRLTFQPEQGLEIIATGRLSIYQDRSAYQLIADDLFPAGTGALMALLEKRKKQFAEQGLFATEHKKPLPFLPATIGVVTSPTGAVIRDILHRISERFPVRVIVWPTLVQGNLAAGQIVTAINGFNTMTGAARPDLLIVARGGGSIEDLWPFNEENVVRAAFDSAIPLISAIGHETDTTLLDYVCDVRAPTPTGAAEIAVPVRAALIEKTDTLGQRLDRIVHRHMQQGRERVQAAHLPRPERWLNHRYQRFDMIATRLPQGLAMSAGQARSRLNKSRLPDPGRIVRDKRLKLNTGTDRLANTLRAAIGRHTVRLTATGSQLRPETLRRKTRHAHAYLARMAEQLPSALTIAGTRKRRMFDNEARLLETLSYQATLQRGYAIVRTRSSAGKPGSVISSRKKAADHKTLGLEFKDGAITIYPAAPVDRQDAARMPPGKTDGTGSTDGKASSKKRAERQKSPIADHKANYKTSRQGDLF